MSIWHNRRPLAPLFIPESAYLLLVWSIGDWAHLGISLSLIGAAALLMLDSAPLNLRSRLYERIVGLALLGGAIAVCFWLWRQQLETTEQHPLRILPLWIFASAIYWREGRAGIRHRWRELTILFFLGGPHLLVWWLEIPTPLAHWSAKTATYLLWYFGADVVGDGASIILSGKGVLITEECAGIDTIIYLLAVAVLTVFYFPLSGWRTAGALMMATAIGFLTNVIRISVLAILNAYAAREHFDYWHTSEGAQVFGVLAMIIFWIGYFYLHKGQEKERAPVDA